MRAEWRTEHISELDIEIGFEDGAGTDLQQLLCDRTRRKALDEFHSAGIGNGLVACRIQEHQYAPVASGTTEAILKQVLCINSAGRIDEVEHKIRNLEDFVRSNRSEGHALGRPSLQGVAFLHGVEHSEFDDHNARGGKHELR